MSATRKRGETASQALRRFIGTYIEEARLAENPSAAQVASMTLARHRLKTIATAVGAAIGAISIAALPSAAHTSAFEQLDKNKDGVLTEGEIAPGHDATLISRLDTDGSGSLSQSEVKAAGKIIIETSANIPTGEEASSARIVVRGIHIETDDDGVLSGTIPIGQQAAIEETLEIERVLDGDEMTESELQAAIEGVVQHAHIIENMSDVGLTIYLEKEGERVIVYRERDAGAKNGSD
ncbi:MAG: EF-hand domain-containing protein [Pseudomonadota bacterium]